MIGMIVNIPVFNIRYMYVCTYIHPDTLVHIRNEASQKSYISTLSQVRDWALFAGTRHSFRQVRQVSVGMYRGVGLES